MIRTSVLVVVLAVALGGAAVGTSHVAGQADEPVVTVDLGAIEGATVCAQQFAPDTNGIVIRSDDGNVTIHLDGTRRVELGEPRSSEGAIVLRTDRRNETLNDLAAAEECFTARRTDIVVDARSVELRSLSVTEYAVEVGSKSDVPVPTPFDPPHESDGEDGGNETDTRGNEPDSRVDETDGQGNESDGTPSDSAGDPISNDSDGWSTNASGLVGSGLRALRPQ
ncbi:hypothetical protein [Halopiger djelfimassiliensis]|uniref:hypothetical protein n=1 Tax=Halopiger djelfimassiliensis TaxID=1293047 RepID=UPI00067758BC|nr:hypothetical protein [Halopiger djelfimassiliensis]